MRLNLKLGICGNNVGISAAPSEVPENIAVPVISGLLLAGSVLTCSTGTWLNRPSSYAYQWQNAGSDISGATSSTYTVALTDEGDEITCEVVASNAIGDSSPAESAAVTIISGIGFNLDVSNASSITLNGSTASQINDISGNGRHFKQATATKQPAYDSGTQSLTFDGTDDWMTNGSPFMWDAGHYTVLMIAQLISGADADTYMAETAPGFFFAVNRMNPYLGGYVPSPQIYSLAEGGSLLNNLTMSYIDMIGLGKMSYIQQDTGGEVSCFSNGVAGSAPRTYTATRVDTPTAITLGAENNRRFANIKLYQAMAFNRVLTAIELNHIGAQMATKWGITWTDIT